MLSFQPSGSKAVFIGTTICPKDSKILYDLPSVENNLRELKSIFEDKKIIGVPTDNTLAVLNAATSVEMLRTVRNFTKSTTDLLFVYYAGHGMKSPDSDGLYLATCDTTSADCHIDGVEFTRLKAIINQSSAANKILVFDCCYSGEITSASSRTTAERVIGSNIEIDRTYSIASAPRNGLAYAPSNETFTAFTKELIHVLRNGLELNKPSIEINELYREVKRRLEMNADLPQPQRKVLFSADDYVIAKNISYTNNPEFIIANLRQRIDTLNDRNNVNEQNAIDDVAKLENEIANLKLTHSVQLQDVSSQHDRAIVELNNKALEHVRTIQEEHESELEKLRFPGGLLLMSLWFMATFAGWISRKFLAGDIDVIKFTYFAQAAVQIFIVFIFFRMVLKSKNVTNGFVTTFCVFCGLASLVSITQLVLPVLLR